LNQKLKLNITTVIVIATYCKARIATWVNSVIDTRGFLKKATG